MDIRIVDAGILMTVQDLGRYQVGSMGVSPGGAADWFSAAAANRLAGNYDRAALLELTISGAIMEICRDASVAVTGAADCYYVDDAKVAAWSGRVVKKGSLLRIPSAQQGCRSYVAFAGGLDVLWPVIDEDNLPGWSPELMKDLNVNLGIRLCQPEVAAEEPAIHGRHPRQPLNFTRQGCRRV